MTGILTISDNLPITDESVTADKVAWWESAFLEEFAQYCNVSKACLKAKVSRSTVYDHYNANTRFQQLFEAAKAVSTDKLRETALKLATGEFEVTDSDGKKRNLQPNTAVLMRLLAAHDPSYREVSRSEVTGKDGGAIETRTTNTLDGLDQKIADSLIADYVKRQAEQSNKP